MGCPQGGEGRGDETGGGAAVARSSWVGFILKGLSSVCSPPRTWGRSFTPRPGWAGGCSAGSTVNF